MFIKKDGRRRLFILDEAWEYIGESNGDDAAVNFFTKFLEAAWRRFRKTNCAGICITQSFEDFYKYANWCCDSQQLTVEIYNEAESRGN